MPLSATRFGSAKVRSAPFFSRASRDAWKLVRLAVKSAEMLPSALTIAFYYVWSVELTEQYGTATVAAWSTVFGFLALLPYTDLH